MIIYILFVSIFFLDYLSEDVGVIPRIVTWIPELLSLAASILVISNIVKYKELFLSRAYIILFSFLALLLTATTIANAVPAGAIFVGVRTYLKFIPFFLLPAVAHISNEKLLSQLKFLLALALLQVPITAYQRFIQYAGFGTGDVVTGTLTIPSVLTIVSLSVVSIILSAYYKKAVSTTMAFSLIIFLLIPPTINETAITLFLLPLAFIMPTVFYIKYAENKKRVLVMVVAGIISMAFFAVGYNYFYGDRWGGDITNLVTHEDIIVNDLAQQEWSRDKAVEEKIGRFDSIRLAYEYLTQYPTKILMGVGMGNANSSFSKRLRGDYSSLKETKGGGMTALSSLLWDMGIIGTILIIIIFSKIFFDVRGLIGRNDIYGILALGWLTVTSFIIISLIYKNLIPQNALGYLFWYLSGCLVSERYRTFFTEAKQKYPVPKYVF